MKVKVRRGQRGRVEKGKVTAGLAYGYAVVKKFDSNGEPIRGDREIVPEKAEIVRRILSDYAAGKSPKAIAKELNADGIPSPTGKKWHPSTINGHRDRGYGILNCDLYRGKIVWNKVREDREPGTNRRVPRPNPPSEWVTHDAEHLRIVTDELWDAVKAKQKQLSKKRHWNAKKRPKYLLSGLLKCGKCGGGYSMAEHGKYACSNYRSNGTCDNARRIKRLDLEQTILSGLEAHLLSDELLQEFCNEFTRHINTVRMKKNARIESHRRELAKVEAGLQRCIESIKEGIPGHVIKDEMVNLDQKRQELISQLADQEQAPAYLHPRMGDHYRSEIGELVKAMQAGEHSIAAQSAIRTLIDQIVLTPDQGTDGLIVNLHGDLAGILAIAEKKEKKPMHPKQLAASGGMSLQMVGPEGLEPPTRPL